MFQLEPVQLPHCAFLEIHCCWGPEPTFPSMRESEIQPPLPQPPFWWSTRLPRTCMRRKGTACETAHCVVPPELPVAKFSTPRQTFWVALLLLKNASERTLAMETSPGDRPSPCTCV